MGMLSLTGLFLFAYIAFFYHFQTAREIADAELDGYLEVLLLGVPILVLVGGVLWMDETAVDDDLFPRVIGWTVGVGVFFLIAIAATLFVLEPRYDRGERLLMLQMAAGFGVSAGTVMGVIETRSIQRFRDRARAAVALRRRRQEKQRLQYLNQYLRHEVLNEVNKIGGYADMLASTVDADTTAARNVTVIQESADEVAAFIDAIRSLMDISDRDPQLKPVAVTQVAAEAVEQIRRVNPSATITVEGPATAAVRAGALLDRVITNLVENAIQHNGDGVTVRVEIETSDEHVWIRVHDDGTGIPARAQETLFEPPSSGDHGYGLYLTRHLVELYGGRLTLEQTGTAGTTFGIRLPAAAAETESLSTAANTDRATT
jgi:signal transduction histidine kinase